MRQKMTRPFLCCWRQLANTIVNNQTTSGPKHDVHTKFHEDLICRFDVIVIGLSKYTQKMVVKSVTVCACVLADLNDPGPFSVTVCASGYGDPTCSSCAIFSETIQVKLCEGTNGGSNFYVYQLKATTFCDMAYCAILVDTPNGIPPLISTT